MYKLSSSFDFHDVYNLVKASRDITLGKLRFDNNLPKDMVFQSLISDLKEMMQEGVLKLALIDESEVVNGFAFVEKSNWDSSHFRMEVGKLRLAVFNAEVQINDRRLLIRGIKDLAFSKGFDIIFARVPLEDMRTIHSIELEGGILTDVLLTFYIDLTQGFEVKETESDIEVTSASQDDKQILMRMAEDIFKIDHFHADPNLPSSKCDELYAKWVANCIDGLTDVVLMAKKGDDVIGFITCKVEHLTSDYNYGIIDLVGVGEGYRGKGIGSLLVSEALKWFSNHTNSVYVGTQAANIPAVRLYEKMGFHQVFSEATLHLWLSAK